MVHNWVSRVYLPNSVIRASSVPALWRLRATHHWRIVPNSASSSSARISTKRRMAADWGVKSGIKTRRSTSGRVWYRRRMKPSSVAGIAPKHSRISSGLRPRRRALESAIGIRRFPHSACHAPSPIHRPCRSRRYVEGAHSYDAKESGRQRTERITGLCARSAPGADVLGP